MFEKTFVLYFNEKNEKNKDFFLYIRSIMYCLTLASCNFCSYLVFKEFHLCSSSFQIPSQFLYGACSSPIILENKKTPKIYYSY